MSTSSNIRPTTVRHLFTAAKFEEGGKADGMSKSDAMIKTDGMRKTEATEKTDGRGKIRLAVVGSRSLDVDISPFIPAGLEVGAIISGGAVGVDARAAEYARREGIELLEFRPDYGRFGRGAPLKRNDRIIDAADLVLIIWDGVSRGSQYVMRRCEKTGKPFRVCRVSKCN